MSVYNGERWLSEAIQSVLRQTFKNFEFIIINDGSTDGSLKIMSEFAAEDDRVRVFNKLNTGLTDSLNYGIMRSRGKWIARIDADDQWVVSKLKKQVDFANGRRGLVLIGTGLRFTDCHGNNSQTYIYPDSHKKLVDHLEYDRCFFPHSSALFRTEAARKLSNYRIRFDRSQDRDLWLRLSELGEILCISEPLVLIRKHGGQISHDEGGRRQVVDSYVAMVCHWLRKMHYGDPATSFSNHEFFEFRAWIEKQVEYSGVYELSHYVADIKRELGSSNPNLIKYALLFILVISSPHLTYLWLTRRFFGSRLPKTLAKKWMIRSP